MRIAAVTTKWRPAKAEDYPAIEKCHRAMVEKIGRDLELPAFKCPSVMAWWVAERGGEVVHFYYLEAVVEFRMGGSDREAMQELLRQEAPRVIRETRQAFIRYLHVCVPPEVERRVARKLKRVGIEKSRNLLFAADLR